MRLVLRLVRRLPAKEDRPWLDALLAELPAQAPLGVRLGWLAGAVQLLAYSILRRLFRDQKLWAVGLAGASWSPTSA